MSSLDPSRADFMKDYAASKQKKVDVARAKHAEKKRNTATSAAASSGKTVQTVDLERQLKIAVEENRRLKNRLEKVRGIAVGMSSRSNRMTQVPTSLLKTFAVEILDAVNSRKS